MDFIKNAGQLPKEPLFGSFIPYFRCSLCGYPYQEVDLEVDTIREHLEQEHSIYVDRDSDFNDLID